MCRSAGHECDTAPEEGLGGAADPPIYRRCQQEGRVLLTLDLGFADIRVYPPDESSGIMVFRPHEPDRDRILRLVRHAVAALEHEPIAQSLWIVEETRIRVRRSGGAAV